MPATRWDALFADLDGQFAAAEAAELAEEVADRTRREIALVRLVDRLRSAVGHPVVVTVAGLGRIEGRLAAVGPDWLLLAEPGGREALVAAAALQAIDGLPPEAAPPDGEGVVAARLDLRHALRGLARTRVGVVVALAGGGSVTGTVDRVGADFVEIAEHSAGEPRRRSEVRRFRVVPLGALAAVRSS
jgi:hypothetical protein